jgi:hypothetical protein
MIHIEISTEPHYKEVVWSKDDPLSPTPDSPPPHVFIKREFATQDEAKQYIDRLGISPHSSDQAQQVLNAPSDEYVQVEIELMDLTDTLYTKAALSIEGQEEQ